MCVSHFHCLPDAHLFSDCLHIKNSYVSIMLLVNPPSLQPLSPLGICRPVNGWGSEKNELSDCKPSVRWQQGVTSQHPNPHRDKILIKKKISGLLSYFLVLSGLTIPLNSLYLPGPHHWPPCSYSTSKQVLAMSLWVIPTYADSGWTLQLSLVFWSLENDTPSKGLRNKNKVSLWPSHPSLFLFLAWGK